MSEYHAITYHSDGTVTYWSVYEQGYRRARRPPYRELREMPHGLRERVMRHCGIESIDGVQ